MRPQDLIPPETYEYAKLPGSLLVPKQQASTRTLYVVRHGTTDSDTDDHIHDGWLPTPLNAGGLETARKLSARFAKIRPLHIYTSPCIRAIQTAHQIHGGDNAVTVTTDIALGPWMIGNYQGTAEADTYEEIIALMGDHNAIPPTDDPINAPAESWGACVYRFLSDLKEKLDNTGTQPVVLLTHSWNGLLTLACMRDDYNRTVPATGTKPRPGTVFKITIDVNGSVSSLEQSGEDDPPFDPLDVESGNAVA